MSCPCHECRATQLADILTDLIAELRKPGHSYGHYLCKADEAEARLREVQGE